MKTVALLTDFGTSDSFAGVMKAVMLGINPRLNCLDITHEVKPQDIFSAAILLAGSYAYFPKGTVFLVVVDPGVGTSRLPIAIKTRNYFFVGPDNGVLSLAAYEDGVKKIVRLENRKYFLKKISQTFHGRDIFAPVAARLSKGIPFDSLGAKISAIKRLRLPALARGRRALKGEVIYIDRFGNLVTNIDQESFRDFIGSRTFSIRVRNKTIRYVATSYQAVRPGVLLAIFGSFGFLEIAVSEGDASRRLGARKGAAVSIVLA